MLHLSNLSAALLACSAGGDALPVSSERISAAYHDAAVALVEQLAVQPDFPALKLCSADDIARAVAAENLPAVRLRQPDDEKAKLEAQTLGAQFATFAYAKYAWSTKEFLVVAATWEQNARVLDRPELTSDAALRAVLVHELCHALDDRAHDLTKLVGGARGNDAVLALNALIEGHAQFVARGVCEKAGWKAGFDTFTSSIGALAPSSAANGELVRSYLESIARAARASYVDGERFVAALAEKGGAQALERVFREPPLDLDTVLHPEWYLDPTLRPAQMWELEPALDLFAARFDATVWSSQRVAVQGAQLLASMQMLPKEEIEPLAAKIRGARLIQLAPTAAPMSKVAIGIAIEFADDSAARDYVAAAAKLSKLKDEAMKKGVARITASKSSEIAGVDCAGWLHEKEMVNGVLKFSVATIDLRRGPIVVETVFSGEPPPVKEHEELAVKLLDAVKRKP